MSDAPRPRLEPVGDNPVLVWGMTNAERTRRIAAARKLDGPGPALMLANQFYAWDPSWAAWLAHRPGTVLTRGGVPVLAHVDAPESVRAAMLAGEPLAADGGLAVHRAEDPDGIFDEALRKRERPFAEPLTPATVPLIERESYRGAYKGVTDLLTKYLWPVWAFHLTRLCARAGISPNGVTAIGSALCALATVLFWRGAFWPGLAVGLVFMVLDTVDGKLARCTITSSRLGNAWDHGVDLVHPPLWWWAWAVGCAPYGRALTDGAFWFAMAAMATGYVAQRLIEGAFIVRFGMHIHVWRRFDSDFRLVTARRNPNMVLLLAGLAVDRPDWGILVVAGWTLLCLAVHLVRLAQAELSARRAPVVSWLA